MFCHMLNMHLYSFHADLNTWAVFKSSPYFPHQTFALNMVTYCITKKLKLKLHTKNMSVASYIVVHLPMA